MFKHYAIALTFLAAGAASADTSIGTSTGVGKALSFKYVQSAKEYEKIHMPLHVLRVKELGLAAMAQSPEDFKGISEDTFARLVLLTHDQSKSNTSAKFLAKHGYDRAKPTIPERLFVFYGRTPEVVAEQERRPLSEAKNELKTLIAELNKIDESETAKFYTANNITDERRLYSALVQVSDVVDRALDPVATEEFGRPMKLASEIYDKELTAVLANDPPTPRKLALLRKQKKWAKFLEKHYGSIVKRYRFPIRAAGVFKNTFWNCTSRILAR